MNLLEEELDEAMRRFRSHIKHDLERPFIRPKPSFVTTKAYTVYGDTLEELNANKEKKIREILEDNVR